MLKHNRKLSLTLTNTNNDNYWFSRLRHNVIKAGVRMINLSYSRISLSDIALKLQLDSPEDAEFIVAKVSRMAN